MIRVHHLEDSRSHRILWLLEEMKLDYEVRRYERQGKRMGNAKLKRIHPLGKAPIVEDDAIVLVETGAIVDHFTGQYDRLGCPHGHVESRRFRFYMHYAEGSLMPPLFASLLVWKLGLLGRPARGFLKRYLKDHFDFIEGELDDRDYMASDSLTSADIMMSFPLEASAFRGMVNDKDYPLISAWLRRIQARPAYQRALERGGDYRYAGKIGSVSEAG